MNRLWQVIDTSGLYRICVKANTNDDAKAIAKTFLNNKYGGDWFEFENFIAKVCDCEDVLSWEDLEV